MPYWLHSSYLRHEAHAFLIISSVFTIYYMLIDCLTASTANHGCMHVLHAMQSGEDCTAHTPGHEVPSTAVVQ